MTRLLAILTLSLTVFGCAAGTEDPSPAPTPDQPQRDPPAQTLSGTLDNPYQNAVGTVDEYRLPPEVPQLQAPPIPGR